MINKLVFFLAGLLLLFLCSAGCTREKGTAGENNTGNPVEKVTNPAVRKCLEDGYQVEAVKENGVVREYLCVNPETGKKCEVWSYFRNECSLEFSGD